MIVPAAGVPIALLDAQDARHRAAEELFVAHVDEGMTIGPVNLAEVLVRPDRDGRDEEVLADSRSLGVSTTPLPDDAGPRLARLRSTTHPRMPACCVLLMAQQVGASALATFDHPLGRVAVGLGLRVVGP